MLERNNESTGGRDAISQMVCPLEKHLRGQTKHAIGSRPIMLIFDGSAVNCEAYIVAARCTRLPKIYEFVLDIVLLERSPHQDSLAQVLSVAARPQNVASVACVGAVQKDGASVNTAAFAVLKRNVFKSCRFLGM
jgi:hypothetical protein